SCFLSSGITMILSWINYYKFLFRNDPFLFGDIAIAGEAKVMTQSYKVVLTPLIIAIMVLIVIFSVIMLFYFRVPIKRVMPRIILVLLALLVGNYGFIHIYLNEDIYAEALDVEFIQMWAPNDQFISRGFLYPFIYSTQTAFDRAPEGYNENEVKDILSAYTYADIPEDKKVNIISVMLESWGDLSKFDCIEFENDPYEILEPLYEKGYSGELVTDIFAAGTVTSERQFLTGSSSSGEYRMATNSYVWYFKEQGYKVEGGHPSYPWFYNRKNINMNLGFDDYYFDDDHYMALNEGQRLADNMIVFQDLMDMFDKTVEKGEYYFNFSVTYQSHGPYGYNVGYESPYIVNKGYSDDIFNNVNNYLSCMDATNRSVVWLANRVFERQEPVVLILFGDHMPGLGENNSGYHELGINIDLSSEEGFKNYYSTPYLIIANDAAKEKLGCDFSGKGPAIAPYFLMTEFFELAGYKGDEFAQYVADASEKYDVYHSAGLIFKDGAVVYDTAASDVVNELRKVEYYRRNNFSYAD
ncbi:MAG: sulfatase-like hydrolase/transferase, partial [Clostridia bacterium]|nr:sulfatase-like hydrolase/transferase [Clostridia bacterium]